MHSRRTIAEFSLQELDADRLVRLFPGMEDMEIRYHRCPANPGQ